MSEETDAPTGGAEGVEPTAVETPSEAATEQTTGTEDAGLADDAGEAAEEPKRVPWFQKRIDEVTAKKYDAEREAAYWRGIAEGKSPTQAQPQPTAAALPTIEDFGYDEAAHAKAVFELAKKEAEQSFDRKLTEREKAAAEAKKNNTAIDRLRTGGAKHADFTSAVSGITATEAVRDFLLDDDNAPAVLYALGKDTAALERFNNLSPVQQAIELGKRSATPKVTARTIAPPPPTTVSGLSAGINKPAEKMDMAEYAAARKAGSI